MVNPESRAWALTRWQNWATALKAKVGRPVFAASLQTSPSPGMSPEPLQPLQGLRLVVTGLDLQQGEHRGIAMYSKAVLRALRASGAELWLLTEFEPRLQGDSLRSAPGAAKQIVFAARVLEALNRGFNPTLIPLASTALAKKSRLVQKALKAWTCLMELPNYLILKRRYQLNRSKKVNLLGLFDNPYARLERLSYLEDLSGIVCARNVFINSYRAALGEASKPIKLQLGSFDGLVTTCPLHISVDSDKVFIQTIHDLIPLEWVQQHDHAGVFSRRLQSCLNAHRLFVSSSTQQKFQSAFGQHNDNTESVVIQPPSLKLPAHHQRRLLEQSVLRPSPARTKHHGELLPFRYVLFNSSIEPRKNLLLIIKAFHLSGLAEHGIRLCITGKLKTDAYSKAVSKQNNDSILLTGYIDEITKTNLFLHALIVLSPSLVEGFGIPVLDAACIGAPVIASPSSSHLEIQSLHDFSDLIWISDTREPLDWSIAMQDLAAAELARIRNTNNERQRRIDRYAALSEQVFESFRQNLCQQVLASAGRSQQMDHDNP
jgi:glycosyltransferase involved in cell wall biosynthesis